MEKIGFGGSCHWCTEAIFQSLKGVPEVLQGWMATPQDAQRYSESVVVVFDPQVVSLEGLIEIHLYTHSCTSSHSMRGKYRSAVYCFSPEQALCAQAAIKTLQKDFSEPIITEILDAGDFKLNQPQYLNYYFSGPEKPFCKNIAAPKLRELLRKFPRKVDPEKLMHLS